MTPDTLQSFPRFNLFRSQFSEVMFFLWPICQQHAFQGQLKESVVTGVLEDGSGAFEEFPNSVFFLDLPLHQHHFSRVGQ